MLMPTSKDQNRRKAFEVPLSWDEVWAQPEGTGVEIFHREDRDLKPLP